MKRGTHRASRWLAATLLGWALGSTLGCGSTGVGNPGPASTGTLSLAIVSDDEDGVAEPGAEPAPPATDDTVSIAPAELPPAEEVVEPLPRGSLERAVLVLGSVRWIPCDETTEVVTQSGPFLVDLLAGETRPPLPELDIPQGGFCGFEAPLAPARQNAEFLGRSLLFSGVRADGVRFLLFANMRATLRLRAPQGQAWGGDGNISLLWAMRPRRWAAPRELAEAETSDSNGARVLVIDVNRHPLLFALIRARLASQSNVFLDRDGDGVLDTLERSQGQVGTGTTDPDE